MDTAPDAAPSSRCLTRRDFLRRSAILSAGAAALGSRAWAAGDELPVSKPVRVVFATDIHLLLGDKLGSAAGLAQCLQAIEALRPRPDFILCGGDLAEELPLLDFAAAEKLLDRFLSLWKDHTSLPTRYAFGNHDFVGTKNPSLKRDDPRFGKGLFRQRLGMEQTFYAFDAGPWRFVVLDDVGSRPDGSYTGEFAEDQLAFLRADLAAHPGQPVVLCGHIPLMSALPAVANLAKTMGMRVRTTSPLVTSNTQALLDAVAPNRARLKLVLSGHLHRFEQMEIDGTRFLTSGAICGNWWRGANAGCPEGFTVIDLQPDGALSAAYQSYGWKAVSG